MYYVINIHLSINRYYDLSNHYFSDTCILSKPCGPLSHEIAATWMSPLLWALMKLETCVTFLSQACLNHLLFDFFIVAIPTGQAPCSPEHLAARIHPAEIMIERAFPIASAHSARAFADIYGV